MLSLASVMGHQDHLFPHWVHFSEPLIKVDTAEIHPSTHGIVPWM